MFDTIHVQKFLSELQTSTVLTQIWAISNNFMALSFFPKLKKAFGQAVCKSNDVITNFGRTQIMKYPNKVCCFKFS